MERLEDTRSHWGRLCSVHMEKSAAAIVGGSPLFTLNPRSPVRGSPEAPPVGPHTCQAGPARALLAGFFRLKLSCLRCASFSLSTGPGPPLPGSCVISLLSTT